MTVLLYEFADADASINVPVFHQRVRDYPWATIEYDATEIEWTEDMFIQIIDTLTSNGVTTSNAVVFEGYIFKIEDKEHLATKTKIAHVVNPAIMDLINYFPNQTVSAGDTDEHIKELQDNCNYITEGTISDGGALNNTSYGGGNSFQKLLVHWGVFDQFQSYLTAQGALQYNSGAVDSGVNYTQANAHYCLVSKRQIRYNKVKVWGSRASGTQIESAWQQDAELQQEAGIKTLELTIPWIDSVANANTMASSILTLLKDDTYIIEIWVQDTTNGVIQAGEEITFSHSVKGIGSAQFKVYQVEYNYKTKIAKYIITSAVYYDVDDFREKTTEELEEQIEQVQSYVETHREWLDADASNPLLIGSSTDHIAHYTDSNIPIQEIIGGYKLYIKSNDSDIVSLYLYDDGTHYLRVLYHKSSDYTLLSSKGGEFLIQTDDAYNIQLRTSGNRRWIINSTGHLYPYDDNSYDIGTSTSNYVKNVYLKGILHGFTYLHGFERSSDPAEPAEGEFVIWMSDGTGKGDDGDIMIASKAGGQTNYGTLFDHSGGAAW